MRCPVCGEKLNRGLERCPNCGTRFKQTREQSGQSGTKSAFGHSFSSPFFSLNSLFDDLFGEFDLFSHADQNFSANDPFRKEAGDDDYYIDPLGNRRKKTIKYVDMKSSQLEFFDKEGNQTDSKGRRVK